MAKPTPQSIAAELTVPERLLLFCLASDTDWQTASITHATAQHMMVRGLIERDRAATRYAVTLGGAAQALGQQIERHRFPACPYQGQHIQLSRGVAADAVTVGANWLGASPAHNSLTMRG